MKRNGLYCASKDFCGTKEAVASLTNQLRSLLYPNIFGSEDRFEEALETNFKKVLSCFVEDGHETILNKLKAQLPEIHRKINTDIEAAYKGDPSAISYDEIMLAYPSFEVLTIHRIANALYQLDIPILPRMMSEYGHSLTGIDIHPGATIGEYFFIDHGTGVVIGETTVIGNNVKLYQGVTLGAKSFKKGRDGVLVKGEKRHPNIGNNIIIYAGATILGGETTIGDNCIIGGNVWITNSIPANTKVIAANVEIIQREIID